MKKSQNLRVLSQLFSTAIFQKIVREDDFSLFHERIHKYTKVTHSRTNLDLLKSLYKTLQKQYRCEYVYKNNLISKLIKEHCLKTTLILNELKIGTSKADLVMLNGSVRVFEIKTELDDFSKLSKQLRDYQKFADAVYIVTDENYAKRLESEYGQTPFGIITLDTKNNLCTIKDACTDTSLFDFETIFKILRKQEYLDLTAQNYGFIPDVPNTQIFKVCYQLLSKINIVTFQKQVLLKIKDRSLKEPALLTASKTPKELKHICNSLDFSSIEYQKLYNFLSSNSLCTSLISEESSLN